MVKTAAQQGNEDTLRLYLAMLLPPLAVYRDYGLKSEFWANLALTCIGIYPGVIHAVFAVLKKMS